MFNLVVGNSYTFNMLAPQTFGSTFVNAKVEGIVSYNIAMLTENVAHLHAKVLPYLPAGTSADPANLSYVIITTMSGARRAIAMDWIADQPAESGTSVIVFRCVGSASDVAAYMAMFAENNRQVIDYTLSN